MDLFEHHYYRLSKNLMRLIGQWPYQSIRSKRRYLVVLLFVVITGCPPPLLALVRYRNDWNTVLNSIFACSFATIGLIKLLDMMWNPQKTLKLLNHICKNWQVWAQDREVNILHEYSEQGEKITILYTDLSILLKAAIYSTIILYTTQPTISKIIDVMLKNGTEPGKFPYSVDYYYFDEQKYYCLIMMHFYMCGCMAAIPLVASDNMLITYVQHVCGVFEALGRKLEGIGNSDTSVENVIHLSSFIDRHNDTIEYANLIEASYTWNFFFLIGLGTILVNILGLQIVMGRNDPGSTIRFIVVLLSLLFIFYIRCHLSQTLTDHSINVGFYICNSQWYRLWPRNQKCLLFMIMRCRVPCQLTAGKMMIMSMRNFLLTIRAAMSYFAVVRPK